MKRTIWIPALALGAVLAANGFAVAQDSGPPTPRSDDGFTMTLGGTGTAAQAASADDTELTHYYRHYYGGYHGYYGGYRGYYGGYRSYYGGYGYGGWGGSYASFGYRPYYRPFYYPAFAYRPYYYPRVTPYVGYYGRGYNRWINGDADDLDASVITLGSSAPREQADIVWPVQPLVEQPGTFRYDGGPTKPVPLPKSDATGQRKAEPAALPVSLPVAKPASPYTYKAYGEK